MQDTIFRVCNAIKVSPVKVVVLIACIMQLTIDGTLPLPTIIQHAPHSLTTRPLQLYNSPANLYSDQALAEALIKPVAVTGNGTAPPREKYKVRPG